MILRDSSNLVVLGYAFEIQYIEILKHFVRSNPQLSITYFNQPMKKSNIQNSLLLQ